MAKSPAGDLTVLLANLEEPLLKELVTLLVPQGYTVSPARSGAEAERSLAKRSVDVMLCDASADTGEWFELVRAAQRRAPLLAAVLLLDSVDNDTLLRMTQLPNVAGLVKPAGTETLTAAISNLLQRRQAPPGLSGAPPSSPSASLGMPPAERWTATDAKNNFSALIEAAQEKGAVEITKRGRPTALVMAVPEASGDDAPSLPDLDALDSLFDALVADMQGPEAEAAALQAFGASPEALGEAARLAAQKA